MEEPATAPWDLSISDADFEKLKAGFASGDMDDHWIISVTDLDQNGKVSIHISRSWTRKELYRLAVKPSDGASGVKIEAITWEQNKGGIHISEEQGKKEAVLLCRSILGCDIDTLPEYDSSTFWNHPGAQLDAKTSGGPWYFTYIWYFDQPEVEEIPPIGKYVWVICHFPLHMCIILLVESIGTFVLWPVALAVAGQKTPYIDQFEIESSLSNGSYPTPFSLFQNWNKSIYDIPGEIENIGGLPPPYVTKLLANSYSSPGSNVAATVELLYNLRNDVYAWVLQNYKVLGERNGITQESINEGETLSEVFATYYLVYGYFFLAAG
ncbi:hypothetical protein MMC17_009897 [Xylographa soralifera]|nr:hypothetical protein [Xylographa soralifera]